LKPERLAKLTEVGISYSTPELFFQQRIDYTGAVVAMRFVQFVCMASCICLCDIHGEL